MRDCWERSLIFAALVGAQVLVGAIETRAGPMDTAAKLGAKYVDDAVRASARPSAIDDAWRSFRAWIDPGAVDREVALARSACAFYGFREDIADGLEIDFLKEAVAFWKALEDEYSKGSGLSVGTFFDLLSDAEEQIQQEIARSGGKPTAEQSTHLYTIWVATRGYNMHDCASALRGGR